MLFLSTEINSLSSASFRYENGCPFGSFIVVCMLSSHDLTSITRPPLKHCTHSRSRGSMLCVASLCHLVVDCGHVVCFCFSFQFFHAQYCTEEVLCIPCQFQYVLLHTLALLSFCILHCCSSFSSSLSPFGPGSGRFKPSHFLRFA